MSGYCPSADHDGALVRVERSVSAVRASWTGSRRHIHRRLCSWCCEGHVAQLLRDGYTVTIEPVSCTEVVPNTGAASPAASS